MGVTPAMYAGQARQADHLQKGLDDVPLDALHGLPSPRGSPLLSPPNPGVEHHLRNGTDKNRGKQTK